MVFEKEWGSTLKMEKENVATRGLHVCFAEKRRRMNRRHPPVFLAVSKGSLHPNGWPSSRTGEGLERCRHLAERGGVLSAEQKKRSRRESYGRNDSRSLTSHFSKPGRGSGDPYALHRGYPNLGLFAKE